MRSCVRMATVAALFFLSACGPPGVFLSDGIRIQAGTIAASVAALPRPSTTPADGGVTVPATPEPAPADPVITSVSPNNGGPGAVVELTGSGFETSQTEFLLIAFFGAFSPAVTRVDSSRLRVAVPLGAISGDVKVLAGTRSSGAIPFRITQSIALEPGDREFAMGSNASMSYLARAYDVQGEIATPSLLWSISGPAAKVDQQGTVTPLAIGSSVLKVSSGIVSKTAKVTFFRVEGVSIEPAVVPLAARPPSGPPDSIFKTAVTLSAKVHASDRQDRLVEWDLSRKDLVTWQPTGNTCQIETQRDATAGIAIVTATAIDDRSRVATAAVIVTREAGIELGVR